MMENLSESAKLLYAQLLSQSLHASAEEDLPVPIMPNIP